jgi:hypothetical protein
MSYPILNDYSPNIPKRDIFLEGYNDIKGNSPCSLSIVPLVVDQDNNRRNLKGYKLLREHDYDYCVRVANRFNRMYSLHKVPNYRIDKKVFGDAIMCHICDIGFLVVIDFIEYGCVIRCTSCLHENEWSYW